MALEAFWPESISTNPTPPDFPFALNMTGYAHLIPQCRGPMTIAIGASRIAQRNSFAWQDRAYGASPHTKLLGGHTREEEDRKREGQDR